MKIAKIPFVNWILYHVTWAQSRNKSGLFRKSLFPRLGDFVVGKKEIYEVATTTTIKDWLAKYNAINGWHHCTFTRNMAVELTRLKIAIKKPYVSRDACAPSAFMKN